MGAVGFHSSSSSVCPIKSSGGVTHCSAAYSSRPSCFPFDMNQGRRVNCMASTIPVQEMKEEGQLRLTGDSFIRPHLRKLSPYHPILPFEVSEALGSMKFPYIYPDPESRRLRGALAQDSGLGSEYILAGCGADELIDLIMRCVLDPGDKIVDCPPTFTMYEFDAAVNGALVVKVPRKSDFSLDTELIAEVVEQERPKCMFLTSPNNPDGRLLFLAFYDLIFLDDAIGLMLSMFNCIIAGSDMITCVGILLFHSIISDEVLLKILDLPILVVLDEAYIEFSGIESRMQWVKKHENLIVLRTFSKRAGLAGLRVGYGAFPLSIIEYLWRAKQPYNVSVAAEISACAALKNPDYLEKVKMALVEERERLFQLLKEVPFLNPYPSHSNFILSEVMSGMDAKKLKVQVYFLVTTSFLSRNY
ncbi:hypothetical protein C3L33_17307, partial [Rhododendron williamsianum]